MNDTTSADKPHPKPHPVHFTEDGEPLEIETNQLTMSEILALVGKKPDEWYLVEKHGREKIEFHDPEARDSDPRGLQVHHRLHGPDTGVMNLEGPDGFAAELADLGYEVERVADFVIFRYEVDIGPLDGDTVSVALQPVDHPRTPPTGPPASSRLLPLRTDGSPAPHGGVHDAASRGFPDPDGVWEYWSRPFNEWADHGRTAESYLNVHLRPALCRAARRTGAAMRGLEASR